jgi:hypothetical protein
VIDLFRPRIIVSSNAFQFVLVHLVYNSSLTCPIYYSAYNINVLWKRNKTRQSIIRRTHNLSRIQTRLPFITDAVQHLHEWNNGKWSHIYSKGITLSTITKINTLLIVDDQGIRPDSEDNLQSGVLTLKKHSKNFGIEILPENFEMMTFLVQDPVRCQIVVDNKCWQQIQNFQSLDCEISYVNAKDMQC